MQTPQGGHGGTTEAASNRLVEKVGRYPQMWQTVH